MTNNKDLDQNTIDTVTAIFQEVVGNSLNLISDKISEIDQRVESLEKQFADLIIGYGEQAVFMEALVAQLAFATDDQRAAFNNSLSEARQKMIEVMRDVSATDLASENPNVASAVEDLAQQKLLDTDL